jgi:hypothetical protein
LVSWLVGIALVVALIIAWTYASERRWRRLVRRRAAEDPPGLRTVASFVFAPIERLGDDPSAPAALLRDLARSLRCEEPFEASSTVLRAPPGERRAPIDLVRLARRDTPSGAFTLELTRDYTGLDDAMIANARYMLALLHDALAARADILELRWHPRQDTALAAGVTYPFDRR